MNDDIPLFIFAKAPIAGKVKTRLHSQCSAYQAAEIAKILLEESIRTVTKHWPGPVYLSVWLDSGHAFIQSMSNKYSIEVVEQSEGDLGEKMHRTFEHYGYPAAIVGADTPHLNAKELVRAHSCLQQNQPVIGPSLDGGYYLLGLTKPAPSLFTNIDWGTGSVLSATQNRARSEGVTLERLATLQDIDEWEDLVTAAKFVFPLSEYLRCENLTDD